MRPSDERRGPQRRVVATLAVTLALLTTTACGARWTDDQAAELEARTTASGGGGGPVSGNQDTGSDAGLTDGGIATTTGGTGGTATGGTTGGTGGGGTTGGEASGPRPCSAPSDAPGVTDDQITIATLTTLTGVVPGLGQSALAAVQSYVAYRNATGGVCGRKLVMKTADDGQDNGRYRTLVNDLNPSILGIVGGVGGGDAGGAEIVPALGIPAVSVAISEGFQNAATVFDTNPPFADVNRLIGKYKYLYDQGVRKAAVVYLAVDQTRSEVEKQIPQMKAAGIQIVNEQPLPLSTLSYDSAARGVANSGADYLFFLSDGGSSASMARSMGATGYKLKFHEYVTAYGTKFIQLAGSGAEGATSWIRTLPDEDGGSVPEQKAFIEWMGRVAPGDVRDTFASESWVAAKAFFDAVEALPGPITRQAIIAQLKTMTEFDGGGFFGKINLGGKRNNGCFVAMQVQGGKWARLTPSQGFLC